ncbi:MAG: cytochrome P450 [Deltaproteobacteria bacterium]|nr:cytochrome P450 [Deltaproteobacteria bacterium]
MTAEVTSSALREIPRGSLLEALGRMRRMRSRTLEVCRQSHERYGTAVMQSAGAFKIINLFGPDANHFVMVDREGNLSAKRAWDGIMGRVFGGGLLLRDGDEHKHHRRIMQNAFRKSAIRGYSELMGPRIAEGLDAWEPGRMDAFPAFKRLTLDLACSVFLGLELSREEAERVQGAFEAAVAASMSVVRLPIPGLEFQRGLRGRAYLERFFHELLPEKRDSSAHDMFSALCRAENEEGERLSDREIVDHMIFLLMAAHDTTTSALTSLVYELAAHPEWQGRIRDECQALDGPHLDYGDLGRVPNIALAMHETLRRYPPLSTVPRMAERDCSFDGYAIPKGALVVCFPIHTHHMEEWWDEPFRWDPDRFSEPRLEQRRHTHSYVPFSGGAHVCMGLRFAEMQVRSVLFQLVRRFRWSVPDGYEMPVQQAPISKPMDGLPIQLDHV